uniref:Reverse transcriptase domain-containing protein n=1 Tax=Panagrolaimus sp. JU765 TaxID=591449 RepID=A0AC34RH59_9BILA
MYKVMTKVLKDRIQKQMDVMEALPPEEAGFRKNFSTVIQIHALNEVAKKCYEFNMKLVAVFVDFKKEFDSIKFESIWAALEDIKCDSELIKTVKLLYAHGKSAVQVSGKIAEF